MLSFLRGVLVEKALESPKGAYFIMDVHGVGFETLSSRRSVESSPPLGQEFQLFTTMVVREDAIFMVGFNSREERDLFNILQSASGVGAKVALSLLSSLSVSEIAQAVVSNHHTVLTQAKGVGPKLAQKMTLELKEKMMSWRSTEFTTALPHTSVTTAPAFVEAESVLLSLGYQPHEIANSFQSLDAEAHRQASSEVILRESLRWLAQSV